jgi:hypothetical protein
MQHLPWVVIHCLAVRLAGVSHLQGIEWVSMGLKIPFRNWEGGAIDPHEVCLIIFLFSVVRLGFFVF